MPHVSVNSILAELHQRELLYEAERYRRSRAVGDQPKARERNARSLLPGRLRPTGMLRRAARSEPCGCLSMP